MSLLDLKLNPPLDFLGVAQDSDVEAAAAEDENIKENPDENEMEGLSL